MTKREKDREKDRERERKRERERQRERERERGGDWDSLSIHLCQSSTKTTTCKQITHYHSNKSGTSHQKIFSKSHIGINLIRNTVWSLS